MRAAPPIRQVRRAAADRSRTSILDAAERLFGQRGYDAASLAEIADASGLARTTPGYYFKSKERLYAAVVDRLMVDAIDQISMEPQGQATGEFSEEKVESLVHGFLNFLLRRPAFVQIVQRESLRQGGPLQGSGVHLAAVEQGIALLRRLPRWSEAPTDELGHLLVSVIALCWFPVSTGPLLADFGLDLDDPGFVETRAGHIAKLLGSGIGGLR